MAIIKDDLDVIIMDPGYKPSYQTILLTDELKLDINCEQEEAIKLDDTEVSIANVQLVANHLINKWNKINGVGKVAAVKYFNIVGMDFLDFYYDDNLVTDKRFNNRKIIVVGSEGMFFIPVSGRIVIQSGVNTIAGNNGKVSLIGHVYDDMPCLKYISRDFMHHNYNDGNNELQSIPKDLSADDLCRNASKDLLMISPRCFGGVINPSEMKYYKENIEMLYYYTKC